MVQQCFTHTATEGNTNSGSAIGCQFDTGSEYIGVNITQVTFFLKRLNTGSSTNLQATIYDSSGTLQATSTNSIASSTLSTTDFTTCVFTISHTLAAGDRIAVFNGVTGTYTLRPQQSGNLGSGQNPQLVEFQGGTWNANDSYMINFCMTYSGTPSGGTRLPPPPIVLGGY